MTNANLLLRLGPLGNRILGWMPAEVIISSRSSLVSTADSGTEAIISASSTAAFTVASNGCGVASITMSTPQEANSVSRSSSIADVTSVLPARSSRPKPSNSS